MNASPEFISQISQKFKVLVVDDHAVVRRGLVTLINEHPDLEVSGDASNEADAILAFRQNIPDLLLVDWSLKQRDSLGLIVTLLREKPDLRILVLSIHDEMTHADLAVQAGARGYVMKREAGEKIVEGIKTVLGGAFYLSQRAFNGLSENALKRVSGRCITNSTQNTPEREGYREPYCDWAVSIVVPVFNSRETLSRLCDQLVAELVDVDQLQIILVDDGSTDGSADLCAEMRERYPSCVEFLQLARNFGEHNAVLAGIKHATGDFCVIMDDDLQNPPSEVRVLLRHAAQGFDLVYSHYRTRRHPLYRRMGSKLQDWTACLAIGKPRGLYLSSFKVFSSKVMKEVCRYNGPEPYLDAILLRATANIGTVECQHSERGGGRSGYTWRKLIGLWCRLFVGFSVWPVRIAALVGMLFCAERALAQPDFMHGGDEWIHRGATLLLVALVGEYVGRIYLQLNAAPQFVIKHRELRSAIDIGRVHREMETAQRHETL
jgi:undecaprenyl-phosphate 4-deoxy-4-formamido-L-arabinose transferase